MPSFFLMTRRPPTSPLFPSTTLFRSPRLRVREGLRRELPALLQRRGHPRHLLLDRKSTRLNSSHGYISYAVFFFNDTPPPYISPLSLHDALPISSTSRPRGPSPRAPRAPSAPRSSSPLAARSEEHTSELQSRLHLVCRLFF